MKTKLMIGVVLTWVIAGMGGCTKPSPMTDATIQLNWLHDPTFTGEYLLTKRNDVHVAIREGGPNISPLSELGSRRATAAIVGADIFLQAVEKDLKDGKKSQLMCIFVDFQRNPIGWVLHPKAAEKAGRPTGIETTQRN